MHAVLAERETKKLRNNKNEKMKEGMNFSRRNRQEDAPPINNGAPVV